MKVGQGEEAAGGKSYNSYSMCFQEAGRHHHCAPPLPYLMPLHRAKDPSCPLEPGNTGSQDKVFVPQPKTLACSLSTHLKSE